MLSLSDIVTQYAKHLARQHVILHDANRHAAFGARRQAMLLAAHRHILEQRSKNCHLRCVRKIVFQQELKLRPRNLTIKAMHVTR